MRSLAYLCWLERWSHFSEAAGHSGTHFAPGATATVTKSCTAACTAAAAAPAPHGCGTTLLHRNRTLQPTLFRTWLYYGPVGVSYTVPDAKRHVV